MRFPVIPESTRIARLEPPRRKIRMVLDTDTFNEIDDQFALVYALRSPEKLSVEAVYAAPFHNNRSNGPADGMEKSYEEILRVLDRLDVDPEGLVHRGSTRYLDLEKGPERTAAALDLVERAMAGGDDPLYVVAVGAITNVASAILIEPRIIERIVIVWLGGHAHHWPDTREFNLKQDIAAARLVFDSGVPLVQIPCMGVTSHLHTTVPEVERLFGGRGRIGDYLVGIFKAYEAEHHGWSKVIWDISAVAYLIDDAWVPTEVVASPIVTNEGTWSFDRTRHAIRCAYYVHRDPIFRDLVAKLPA